MKRAIIIHILTFFTGMLVGTGCLILLVRLGATELVGLPHPAIMNAVVKALVIGRPSVDIEQRLRTIGHLDYLGGGNRGYIEGQNNLFFQVNRRDTEPFLSERINPYSFSDPVSEKGIALPVRTIGSHWIMFEVSPDRIIKGCSVILDVGNFN